MKSLFLLSLAWLCFAFSGSPLATSDLAEQNRAKLLNVNIGMTEQELRAEMGNPHKIKNVTLANGSCQIFYYVTKGILLGQPDYVPDNFTPVVLKEGKVIGWGNHFYKHYFDSDNLLQATPVEEKEKAIVPVPVKEKAPETTAPKTKSDASEEFQSKNKKKGWFSDIFPQKEKKGKKSPEGCKNRSKNELDPYWWE